MGVVKNIGFHDWPRQSKLVGRRCSVFFHYQTANRMGGVIVRDDVEFPGQTIIQLDDGRFVRAVECQYSLARE